MLINNVHYIVQYLPQGEWLCCVVTCQLCSFPFDLEATHSHLIASLTLIPSEAQGKAPSEGGREQPWTPRHVHPMFRGQHKRTDAHRIKPRWEVAAGGWWVVARVVTATVQYRSCHAYHTCYGRFHSSHVYPYIWPFMGQNWLSIFDHNIKFHGM